MPNKGEPMQDTPEEAKLTDWELEQHSVPGDGHGYCTGCDRLLADAASDKAYRRALAGLAAQSPSRYSCSDDGSGEICPIQMGISTTHAKCGNTGLLPPLSLTLEPLSDEVIYNAWLQRVRSQYTIDETPHIDAPGVRQTVVANARIYVTAQLAQDQAAVARAYAPLVAAANRQYADECDCTRCLEIAAALAALEPGAGDGDGI